MRRSLGFGWIVCSIAAVCCGENVVLQHREIPVILETDIVIAGGSSAAVAAACSAAKQGASVALVSDRPYLGDDLCGRQLLWLEPGESPQSDLAKRLFPEGRVTTPYTIKSQLDRALLESGVWFQTGSFASDLLIDDQGQPAGIVIVNRSGSQAIRTKVVIDATPHATLARQAGAKFGRLTPGEKEFRFIVVGGELQSRPGVAGRKLDVTFKNPGSGKSNEAQPVYEYTAKIAMAGDSQASFARAEQTIRNMVCGDEMQDCSECAWHIPSDTIMDCSPRLHVLSDHVQESQKEMTRPLGRIAVGERVGMAAAAEANKAVAKPNIRLAGASAETGIGTVGEPRNIVAPVAKAGVIPSGGRTLPVLGRYDVVVIGGGTAGGPAAIAAARSGARTLVVEYLDELGGVGTAGLIGSYWYGTRTGFTKEVEAAIGGEKRWKTKKSSGWNVVQKAEWLRRELVAAKADVWFRAFGTGAIVDNEKVRGVVVATPLGVGLVYAKTVIDATGNADVADAAGAETQFGVSQAGVLSCQLAGYPRRNLGDSVNNTCFALVDDTCPRDVWHLMAWSRADWQKNPPYDAGQMVDSRERRRIVADHVLTTMDILNRRTFPDTISLHKSNFDAAAFPTSPMLLVKDMKGPAFDVNLPYRSLLPRGLDGILVVGLGAGAERDAMTLVRMQADLQNQGYAAGLAAAMAAGRDGSTRKVDVKAVQRQLVEQGALPASVLADQDSYPMSRAAIEKAVANVGAMSRRISQRRTVDDPSIFALAAVMAQPADSIPLLRKAHAESADAEKKLTYAQVLGVLGDPAGAATLIAAIESEKAWDKGFGLTWHRESDNTFGNLDRLVIALGYSGSPDGLNAITTKIRQLTPEGELSHFLAAYMALEHVQGPVVAGESLAALLKTPGFAGHAVVDPVDSQEKRFAARDQATSKIDTSLNAAFKELLAAGMLVRCGDCDGLGRNVLDQYAGSVEGHFARFARHLLQVAR